MAAKRKRKKKKKTNNIKEFFIRLGAVFMAYSFNSIAAGALVGINVIQSILMAGIMGIATTFTYMARAYINDGIMTHKELEIAFKKTSDKLDDGSTLTNIPASSTIEEETNTA